MTAEKQKSRLTTPLWVGVGLFGALFALYLGNAWLGTEEPESVITLESSPLPPAEKPQPGTVASAWQWQDVSPSTQTDEIPFNAEAIYQALQHVRIDDNGDVIIDDEALNALNRTLQYGEVDLSDQNLADLQELIRAGLPGKAGEQTARIVVDFYRYLGAEEEFNATYETTGTPGPGEPDFELQYQELQALRAMYLGQDVADKLFATSDANARYMFEVQKVEADDSLTADEKARKLDKLDEQLTEATVPVDNWRARHADFQADKERILSAGLSEEQTRAQVEALMRQHFQPDELARIRYLQLDDI